MAPPVSWLAVVVASLLPIQGARAEWAGHADDSDLAGPARVRAKRVPDRLQADAVEAGEPVSEGLWIEVTREFHGRPVPVQGLVFELEGGAGKASTGADGIARFAACPAGKDVGASAALQTPQFKITGGSRPYSVAARVPCGARTALRFRSDSDGGQALGIWQVGRLAAERLATHAGASVWSRSITFVWPASGDFYSFGQVNVTRGDYWDVVGHELGHAIYDLAKVGAMGGGQHKIDECYSSELALSEGWASWFSAWLHVPLDDPDAKFEYLVPRRAPIRFENVPADVCREPTNEWRVTAFLWDVIDLHDDAEGASEPFQRVWSALAGSRSRSVADAARILKGAGMDPALVDIAWELNFR